MATGLEIPVSTLMNSQGLTRLGGALFQDLPANVAGSFAMGLLASSATLAAAFPGVKSMAGPAAFSRAGHAAHERIPFPTAETCGEHLSNINGHGSSKGGYNCTCLHGSKHTAFPYNWLIPGGSDFLMY